MPKIPDPVPPPGPPELPEVIVRPRTKAKLECPHCGTRGLDNFQYIEDIQNIRELTRLAGRTLVLASHYNVADDGENPRLYCATCGKECRIPLDLALNWE